MIDFLKDEATPNDFVCSGCRSHVIYIPYFILDISCVFKKDIKCYLLFDLMLNNVESSFDPAPFSILI